MLCLCTFFVFVVQFSRFAAASTAAFLLYPNRSALSIPFFQFSQKKFFPQFQARTHAFAAVDLHSTKHSFNCQYFSAIFSTFCYFHNQVPSFPFSAAHFRQRVEDLISFFFVGKDSLFHLVFSFFVLDFLSEREKIKSFYSGKESPSIYFYNIISNLYILVNAPSLFL